MKKRAPKLKMEKSVFTNVIAVVVIVGLIFVAYVLGSSQGNSNGQEVGIQKGKELGRIELLEEQRRAAEDAIRAAQGRLDENNQPREGFSNPLEDTLTKPFGSSITNPLK